MRKLSSIISISVLIVLLSFSLSFASGLDLIKSYPADGGGGLQPENVMVKLYFNEDVSATDVQNINKDRFKLTDAKGKPLPVRVLYSSKNLNEIWVLVNETLKPDSKYKLQILGGLQASNGDTLESDTSLEFSTRNIDADTQVNMGLMAVMVVGMLIFSSISMRRNLKKEAEEKSDNKVNPYKVAKETGKSVKDVVAKVDKEKEKAEAIVAKKNKGKASNTKAISISENIQPDSDTKRVTGARPISSTGSTYITGRKAEAEKAAAKAAANAAAKTTNPKNATGKSKNTKGKKK